MNTIQAQHKTWVDHNFPGQPPMLPAAGMVEEAGELLHALIAQYRLEIWGNDPRYDMEKVKLDIVDAIGDCAIYMVSFCNANGWDFDKVNIDSSLGESIGEKLPTAVLLVRVAAEFFSTHSYLSAVQYLSLLRGIANLCELDFEACVKVTWNKVKERKR